MKYPEPRRRQVAMTQGVFRLLLGLSLVLPLIFVAGALGASVPDPLETGVVVFAAISAVAMGVLGIWALRLIDRDSRLSAMDKSTWRRFVFFSGVIGASLYLAGYLRRDAGGTT